ncbi:hypothetical protein G9A89_006572 [Geosiphon pyriformis]|nr:hypothetical protein G9A89_006572 [Geosiphon pyriformis]
MVFSNKSLLVLKAKQLFSVVSPVFENWIDQKETESSLSLVFGVATGGSVHGFLGAKSVSKNNVKLFYVEFASQVSLEAVFLVELTSSVYLTTLKIAKSLVISKSGSFFAAVVLCNMLLGVSAANIKTALNVFGGVIYIVLKLIGIWQYVVVYFKKLDSAVTALNYWSILVDKNNIRIFFLVNQNETILFHNKFKTKLVNFLSDCMVFEINDMISQVGGQTCFILYFPKSDYCFQFALIDLNTVILKTSTLKNAIFGRKLLVAGIIALSRFSKALKVFKPHLVGFLSYIKASAPLVLSEFFLLMAFVSSVAIKNSLVFFRLVFLESDLAKLFVLVESIVKPIGFIIKIFEQFVNDDLVLSIALGLRVNKVMEMVALKTECGFEDINMFGPYVSLSSFDNTMFSNLISFWKHESAAVKANFFSSCVDERFLLADNGIVSGNSRHFVQDVFRAVCRALNWENFWKETSTVDTIESLYNIGRTSSMEIAFEHQVTSLLFNSTAKIITSPTKHYPKVAESEIIGTNHLGFVKSLFQQYSQQLGLNNNHYPAESAFNFYVNERITNFLGRSVDIELAIKNFYSELIQHTNLPRNHSFTPIIRKINQEIERYTQRTFPITYQDKGKGKLQTPAVTPKGIQISNWKKQRIESLIYLSYYHMPESTINITLADVFTSTKTLLARIDFDYHLISQISEPSQDLEDSEIQTPNIRTPPNQRNQNPELINQQNLPLPPQPPNLDPIAYAPIAKLDNFTGEEDDTQIWLNDVEKTIAANR